MAIMGLVNSYWGIIIPRLADVGGIFLLRQFFISLPKDLDNAARIDGAGEFRIFWQIILPNAKSAVLVVTMGTVFLSTTGAEALYSDMGHVGRGNIYATWPFINIALVFNYFGQGAWILRNSDNKACRVWTGSTPSSR